MYPTLHTDDTLSMDILSGNNESVNITSDSDHESSSSTTASFTSASDTSLTSSCTGSTCSFDTELESLSELGDQDCDEGKEIFSQATSNHLTAGLFNEATISTTEFSIAMLSIFYKHSLTYSSLTDILKLLAQVLPCPNSIPQSNYVLMNKLVDYNINVNIHYCCGFCMQLLTAGNSCSQADCQLQSNFPKFSFVEVRLDKQLERMFSGIVTLYIYIYSYIAMYTRM